MSARLVWALALSSALLAPPWGGAPAWSAAGAAPYSQEELKSVETETEAKVREIREQEITQLRITLGRRLEPNRRADLYLRLAELYLEGYRAAFLLEGRAHEQRLEKGQTDKIIDRNFSKPYLAKGIQASQDIVRLKIPFQALDQVYYFLGFNYGELGQRKESLRYFSQLTTEFPQSPLALEAYRELGDDAFSSGDFRKAQEYYEQAVRTGKLGDGLPRALHKLAWTYYRTKQFDQAIATMKQAVEKSAGKDKLLVLREEALRDLAVFMTETGQVEQAIAYFKSVAGDQSYYGKALEKLGRQYERNVEPQKATQVYESLLRTNPDDEAAFRVRVKLVDLDLRRGRFSDALARLKDAQVPLKGETETMTAAQNLRAMVRRTATEHHETFRKTGSKTALEVSEEFYELYLSKFLAASDPRHETPEIQMYLADVKRELGKSKEASDLYRRVILTRDKRYAKEAGALWTASLAEAMKKQGAKGKLGDEPSAVEKEFVQAADDLNDSLGDTAEGREAALKAAQVLAAYKSAQKDAIKRAERLIDRAPKTTQALTGARLWLQVVSDRVATKQADNGDLLDTIHELRKNQALMQADQEIGGGKLKASLADYESRLRVGTIAQQEKEKDYAAAAKGYESFAHDSGKRELAEKAYGNAVGAYVKGGDFESADRVLSTWLKRYPASPLATDSVRNTATASLIQGRFEQAGSLFEKLGRGGKDGDSLQTAARIFEGFGSATRARQDWQVFLEAYKQSPARFAVSLSLAKSFEADRDDAAAARSYKFCMSGPAELEAECSARLADLYVRGQDLANAKAMYKRCASIGGKKASSPYVAYARYRLADLSEREARFEPLSLPEAQLQKGVTQRLEFLEPLSRSYNAAVEAGGPWGVAALDRLAAFAFGFADEIDRIAPPTPAQAAAFRKSLGSISGPLRNKALQTWNDAYRKAVAGEILSPVVPEVVDRLADHGVAGISRAQGYKGHFRLAGLPVDGGSDGRSRALEKTRERLSRNALDAPAWVDYGNLLWGEGKPGLARIAYDRALGLDARSSAALNNRGVIVASGGGEEDWSRAAEAEGLFSQALSHDEFFLPAKANKAALLNYYRLFARARSLWSQVLAKTQNSDAHDGMGVAQAGMGETASAELSFKAASELGAPGSRFVRVFHEAARLSKTSGKECLSRLDDADEGAIGGFERQAYETLKKTCARKVSK